jgi:hypothetical protein
MSVKIEQLVLDLRRTTEDACKSIASAALDAKKDIASAALDAKAVLASDAAKAVKADDKKNGNNTKVESGFEYFLYNKFTFIASIIGVAFGIYFTFANPQKNADKIIAEVNANLIQHEAVQVESNGALAAQMKLLREGDLFDLKRDVIENRNQIDSLAKEIVKLETIINERIPKK